MNIPKKFSVVPAITGGKTVYTVESRGDGLYNVTWPHAYGGDDTGLVTYGESTVQMLLAGGHWEIVENFDTKFTFQEKCHQLGLQIDYKAHRGGIVGGVKVDTAEGLEALVDVLFKYRVN